MKLNKIIIILLLIIILGICIFYITTNKNHNVLYCNYEKKLSLYEYTKEIKISFDKKVNNIKQTHKKKYYTSSEFVDSLDVTKLYLKNINKIKGVTSKIIEDNNEFTYIINYDLNMIVKENYNLLEINDLQLENIDELKKYYETLNYNCRKERD